jgi:hypothetical protein
MYTRLCVTLILNVLLEMSVNALADGCSNDGEDLRKSIKRVRTGCVTCRLVIPIAMLVTY